MSLRIYVHACCVHFQCGGWCLLYGMDLWRPTRSGMHLRRAPGREVTWERPLLLLHLMQEHEQLFLHPPLLGPLTQVL